MIEWLLAKSKPPLLWVPSPLRYIFSDPLFCLSSFFLDPHLFSPTHSPSELFTELLSSLAHLLFSEPTLAAATSSLTQLCPSPSHFFSTFFSLGRCFLHSALLYIAAGLRPSHISKTQAVAPWSCNESQKLCTPAPADRKIPCPTWCTFCRSRFYLPTMLCERGLSLPLSHTSDMFCFSYLVFGVALLQLSFLGLLNQAFSRPKPPLPWALRARCHALFLNKARATVSRTLLSHLSQMSWWVQVVYCHLPVAQKFLT